MFMSNFVLKEIWAQEFPLPAEMLKALETESQAQTCGRQEHKEAFTDIRRKWNVCASQ